MTPIGKRNPLTLSRSETATAPRVRVTARVMRPVSIDGILADVESGAFFQLEKMPVPEGIWLPKLR